MNCNNAIIEIEKQPHVDITMRSEFNKEGHHEQLDIQTTSKAETEKMIRIRKSLARLRKGLSYPWI